MLVFIGIAILLTLFALAVLLPTLLRGHHNAAAGSGVTPTDQTAANIGIAKGQLAELNEQQANNLLQPEEYSVRKLEIEKALATALGSSSDSDAAVKSGRGFVISAALFLLIPLAAGFGYWKLGTPKALNAEYVAEQNRKAREGDQGKIASVDELLPRLEAHLADNPDDLEGLKLLGVTYLRMQRYEDSVNVLNKAMKLDPANPDLMFQLADATALSNGGQLQGQPENLVNRALSLRPNDPRGLWMLGMLAHQQGDKALAIERWEKLLPLLSNQPQARAEVQELINQSKKELSGGEMPTTDQTVSASNAAEESRTEGNLSEPAVVELKVNVSLSPELVERVKPTDSIYIYAKALNGPPMPLAVVRVTAADLPFVAVLNDAQAMIPAMTLSKFSEVIVGARVSFSGDPVAKSGDLYHESQALEVAPSIEPQVVDLTIDSIVP